MNMPLLHAPLIISSMIFCSCSMVPDASKAKSSNQSANSSASPNSQVATASNTTATGPTDTQLKANSPSAVPPSGIPCIGYQPAPFSPVYGVASALALDDSGARPVLWAKRRVAIATNFAFQAVEAIYSDGNCTTLKYEAKTSGTLQIGPQTNLDACAAPKSHSVEMKFAISNQSITFAAQTELEAARSVAVAATTNGQKTLSKTCDFSSAEVNKPFDLTACAASNMYLNYLSQSASRYTKLGGFANFSLGLDGTIQSCNDPNFTLPANNIAAVPLFFVVASIN